MNMTARTIEDPHIQGHLLPMSTDAACLTRIGRIDSHIYPASFFRFAGQFAEKCRPRGITDAFGQTMVVNHSVHMQVFDADRTKAVYNLPGLLMGKVISTEFNPLMNSGYNLAVLPTKRSAFSHLSVLALDFGQGFLFLAEKAGIGYLLSIRESRKGLESDINPHLGRGFWQAFGFTLTRKADVPFPCRRPLHRTGLHLALDLAMRDHFDGANLGEADPFIMRGRPGGCPGDRDNGDNAKATLREGEAIVSAFAFETGKPRFKSMFPHTPKESFEGQINPHSHILQDLRMHGIEGRPFLFQYRKGRLLLIERQAFSGLRVSRFTLFEQMIVQPSALFKRGFKLLHLLLGGKNPILKGFTHSVIVAQTEQGCKRETALYLSPGQDAPAPNKERA